MTRKKRGAGNEAEPSSGGQQVSLEDVIASDQAETRKKGGTHTGYQRPTKRQKAGGSFGLNRPTSASNLERLEKAVLCGQLWHQACKADNDDLPASLPIAFNSADQYIDCYEALINEEAREAILHSKLDQNSSQIEVTVRGVQYLPSGWGEVSLSPQQCPNQLREGAIMVLSTHQLPAKANVEWFAELIGNSFKTGGASKAGLRHKDKQADPLEGSSGGMVVAGIVRSAPGAGRTGDAVLGIHPQCHAHAGASNAPCCQGLEVLVPGRRLWGVVLSPLVTQQREFTALHKIPLMSLGEHMLHPEGLARIAQQVHEAHPEGPDGGITKSVHGEGILQKMNTQFDTSQYNAIVAATRHLDLDHSSGHQPRMPFVLICGPPGTGKTHTVTGILNIWHLSHYTQHQDSITARLRLDQENGTLSDNSAEREKERVAKFASKPRLLVCAPSNAAADEILQRVMTTGFVGNDGRQYFPNVVRVGAPGANVGDRARAVLVETLVSGYLNMDPNFWRQQLMHLQHSITQMNQHITALKAYLGTLDIPLEEGAPRELALLQEVNSIRNLVERYDARSKLMLQLERLYLVANHVNSRSGTNVAQIRDALELSFVEDAEMVFTTLSSTGRKVFSKLQQGHFETVLIDEAAQASEVTTLQALTFGCQRVVLVGDPQQLPATILSQKGKDLMFERSLFERLQRAGCPVHTLQVQYRMHPFIREFPSRYFYDNVLQDGQSVLDRGDEVFYRHKLLKPYVFFDVEEGRDFKSLEGANSGSRRNQAEADLAVALFQALREELLLAVKKNLLKRPVLVGVITPYKEQVKCIKETLASVLGPELAQEVDVSTVDSYQGRQLDVIILSAVRSNPSGAGVGFLNDVRRLNVSITRAKRALWILGSAMTLRQSAVWAALIEDADKRGAVVPMASARSLFPELMKDDAQKSFSATVLSGMDTSDQKLQDEARASGLSGLNMMKELERGTDLDLTSPSAATNTDMEGHLTVDTVRKGSTAGIPGLDMSPTKLHPGPSTQTQARHIGNEAEASTEDPFLDTIFGQNSNFKATSGLLVPGDLTKGSPTTRGGVAEAELRTEPEEEAQWAQGQSQADYWPLEGPETKEPPPQSSLSQQQLPSDPRVKLLPSDPQLALPPPDPRLLQPPDPRLPQPPPDPRLPQPPPDPRLSQPPPDPRLRHTTQAGSALDQLLTDPRTRPPPTEVQRLHPTALNQPAPGFPTGSTLPTDPRLNSGPGPATPSHDLRLIQPPPDPRLSMDPRPTTPAQDPRLNQPPPDPRLKMGQATPAQDPRLNQPPSDPKLNMGQANPAQDPWHNQPQPPSDLRLPQHAPNAGPIQGPEDPRLIPNPWTASVSNPPQSNAGPSGLHLPKMQPLPPPRPPAGFLPQRQWAESTMHLQQHEPIRVSQGVTVDENARLQLDDNYSEEEDRRSLEGLTIDQEEKEDLVQSDAESGEISQDSGDLVEEEGISGESYETEEGMQEETSSQDLLESIRAEIMSQTRAKEEPHRGRKGQQGKGPGRGVPGPKPPPGIPGPRPPKGKPSPKAPPGKPPPRPPPGVPRPKPPAGVPKPKPPAGVPRPKPPAGVPKPKPPAILPKPRPPPGKPGPSPPPGVPKPKPPRGVPSPVPPPGVPKPRPPAGKPAPRPPPGIPGPKPPGGAPGFQSSGPLRPSLPTHASNPRIQHPMPGLRGSNSNQNSVPAPSPPLPPSMPAPRPLPGNPMPRLPVSQNHSLPAARPQSFFQNPAPSSAADPMFLTGPKFARR